MRVTPLLLVTVVVGCSSASSEDSSGQQGTRSDASGTDAAASSDSATPSDDAVSSVDSTTDDTTSTSDDGASSDLDAGPGSFGMVCGAGKSPVVTGQVFAPNGKDPVPFAYVYVPSSVLPIPSAVACDTCSTATDPSYVQLKTGIDGRFSLDLSGVPSAAKLQLVVRKGRFRKISPLATPACSATIAASAAQTTLPGNKTAGDMPNIAVGSGTVDHLDNVLSAMGITAFDCYEGTTSTKAKCPSAASTGKKVRDLLTDPTKLDSYGLLFLSCAPGIWASYSAADQSAIATNLGAWVKAGGRLIVTDQSYDYLSQTWPDPIVWNGAPRTAPAAWQVGTTSGSGANVGVAPSGGTYAGTIDDVNVTAWLKLPEIGVTTAPSVTLSGWLAPWSVQKSLSTGTTQIAHGTIDYQYPWMTGTKTSAAAPLTSQFIVNKCGRVIYSSYHTDTGSTSLSPQERILEYLMLDSAACLPNDM